MKTPDKAGKVSRMTIQEINEILNKLNADRNSLIGLLGQKKEFYDLYDENTAKAKKAISKIKDDYKEKKTDLDKKAKSKLKEIKNKKVRQFKDKIKAEKEIICNIDKEVEALNSRIKKIDKVIKLAQERKLVTP